MKGYRLVEAARDLDMHPLQVVMCLASLVEDFSSVYPVINEGLLATLRQMLGKYGVETREHTCKTGSVVRVKLGQPQEQGLEAAEVRCLRKLAKKGFWGKKTLSDTELQKNYLQGSSNPTASIMKFVRLGFMIRHGRRRYSLNPKAASDIRNLIRGSQNEIRKGAR